MNKDQAKGHVKDMLGEAERKAGELTGSKKHQAKGALKQAEGKMQKGVGDVKQVADQDNDKNPGSDKE